MSREQGASGDHVQMATVVVEKPSGRMEFVVDWNATRSVWEQVASVAQVCGDDGVWSATPVRDRA